MNAEIKGTVLPVLEVTLNPGDKLVAEAGELAWMTQTIQLTTTTQTGGAKGMMGVLKRAVGGGGIFMTDYEAQGGPGMVAFAHEAPGRDPAHEDRPRSGVDGPPSVEFGGVTEEIIRRPRPSSAAAAVSRSRTTESTRKGVPDLWRLYRAVEAG